MIEALIGLATAAGVALAAWLFGQRKGKQAERDKQAKQTERTKKDIENAIANPDGDDWRDRLRDSKR